MYIMFKVFFFKFNVSIHDVVLYPLESLCAHDFFLYVSSLVILLRTCVIIKFYVINLEISNHCVHGCLVTNFMQILIFS